MLSVCIPIFNIEVKPLVESLLSEQKKSNAPIEILLIDDCSADNFRSANSKLTGELVRYIELLQNIGRSRTRNEFLKYARHDWLLFLDADSRIISSDFIAHYLRETGRGAKVVCGGRIYTNLSPPEQYHLHWNYGRRNESKPATERMRHPYRSFMTNNFMIAKKTLESILFDKRIAGYGHEDTLFGYELKKRKVAIEHIENPVLHGRLETNKEFLKKTDDALANLCNILVYVNNAPDFIEDVTLLKYYFKLKRTGFLVPFRVIFTIKQFFLKWFLLRGHLNCGIFNFYKLGRFDRTMKTFKTLIPQKNL